MTINRYLNIWYGSSVNLYQCEMCSLVINVSYNLWNEWRRFVQGPTDVDYTINEIQREKMPKELCCDLIYYGETMSETCKYNQTDIISATRWIYCDVWHLTHSFHSQRPAPVPAPSPPSECHLLPGTSLTWSARIPDRLEQCADQHLSISTFSMQTRPNMMLYPALSCHPLQHSSCCCCCCCCKNSTKLILHDPALACGDFSWPDSDTKWHKLVLTAGRNRGDQDAIPVP